MLTVALPEGCRAEREYIAAVMLGEFLGLEYKLASTNGGFVEISSDNGSQSLRIADVFFSRASRGWLTPSTLPQVPLQRWSIPQPASLDQSIDVPVIYGRTCGNGDYVAEGAAALELGVDIFGSAFFMLTRYEEVARPCTGPHEWHPAGEMLAVRENFLQQPIVNQYLDVLWSLLQRLWPGLTRRARSYRCIVTHDVDWPFCNVGRGPLTFAKTMAGDIIARRDPSLLARRVLSAPPLLAGKAERDVCNTFDFIMQESETRGIRSAFYFIAGHSGGRIDGNYSIAHPSVRRLLGRIHARGHEIGLHPSYNTMLDANQLRFEFDQLRCVCDQEGIAQTQWGGRQHYLRWRAGATWTNWDEVGLDYDSTVGNAEVMGFRCGVCYEYPVYDVRTRKPLRLRERPLIAMEVSALDLMKLSPPETVRRMLALANSCRRYAGDFVLLWHNSRLLSHAERNAFRAVLQGAS